MRHDSEARRVRRGYAILGGLALVGVLVFNADAIRDRIRGFTDIVALVEKTSGIRPGSPVRVDGVDAGRVLDVGVVSHGDTALIAVELRIRDRFAPVLREGSRVTTAKERFVGQPFVRITTDRATGPPLGTGDTLGPAPMVDLDALLARAEDFPALLDSLYGAIRRLEDVAAERGPRALALAERTASTLEDAADLAQQAREGDGSLALLLSDSTLPARITSLQGTVRRVGTAVQGLASDTGAAGALAGTGDVLARVDRITGRLDELATTLESGTGTLPRLRRDSALLVAIRGVTAQIDTLRADALGLGLRMLVP